MATHNATIRWSASPGEDYAKGQYSRAHDWSFDGGAVVPASASPHIVPAPWSDAAGVDPEEAFVASAASCHMLFFLDFARRAGVVVTSYEDEAVGEMARAATARSASPASRSGPGLCSVEGSRTRPCSATSITRRTKPASSPIRSPARW